MSDPLKIVSAENQSRADITRLGYIGRRPGAEKRDADSWFTPDLYLDSVRAVLGSIDLDPFSSEVANRTVKAAHIFTLEKSAFDHPWNVCDNVRVFMNPPYSMGACGRAVNRFIDEYHSHHVAEGIVLVNNATDTKWFHALIKYCDAVAFTDHRISFWNDDRKDASGNTRGQAFFYFGPNAGKFIETFEKHGSVLKPAK